MTIGDSKKALDELARVRFDNVPWFNKYIKAATVAAGINKAIYVDKYGRPEPAFLCDDPACMACFYYATNARRAYEQVVLDLQLVYEGDLDATVNFRSMFTSIAYMYNVSPDAITKHWRCVDMQFTALQLPILPDEERYRFNRIPEVN